MSKQAIKMVGGKEMFFAIIWWHHTILYIIHISRFFINKQYMLRL